MESNAVEPESDEKVKSLYQTYSEAVQHAEAMLRKHGMESQQFFEADRTATIIWRRIQAAIGIADQHLTE
jgi:hypothetical protein